MIRGKRSLAAVIVLPAGYGFMTALIQFVRVLRQNGHGAFMILPIPSYSAAAGFVCLLLWTTARGMLRDIERPKRTMLKNEEGLDRRDGPKAE